MVWARTARKKKLRTETTTCGTVNPMP